MADRKSSLNKSNWNKFDDAINDVAQKEMCRVFLWLYKGGRKYVGEYLKEIPVEKSEKIFLTKSDEETLRAKEPPTNMDITLLYRLLQHTCGLAKAKEPIWQDGNSSSLEHTLYLIKQERNELSHEGHKRKAREMSKDDLRQKLRYLHGLCTDILVEAARLCGRLGEIVKLTDKVEARLQEIQGVSADGFVSMAKEERLRVKRTKMADEWYQQPVLRRRNRPVGLADLLQWPATDSAGPSFLLVCGEAGVGKSSLCRYLEECWLRPRSDAKDLLQHYPLLLRLCCRNICTCDAVRLLKEELFPEAALQCSNDTLSEVLRTVPTLWVLDGLEEATLEANNLLASFIRKRRPKSTILMTSRPEFGRDFSEQHFNDGALIPVSLLGTDPLETIRRVTLSNNCDENMRQAKSLMEEFKKLDTRVQQELMNPHKMRLALKDWKTTRTSTRRREFELSTLYRNITDEQIEALTKKLSEQSVMTKSEATRKVTKWFRFLCKSTFDLVQSRSVFAGTARKEFLKKLEDKCDELKVSSSMCMSTFLADPASVFSTDNNNYTFYHDSQVHFLAARHIASVMQGSQYLPEDKLMLFNIAALQEHASEEPPLLHFFDVLLLLVPLIDASTPDDNIRMAIKLLINAIPIRLTVWMWFEVAKKASYQPKVMREIARVIPKLWNIDDSRIEGATKMLMYQKPDEVRLRVVRKPEDVKELKPLLHTLANLPIVIHLELRNHIKDLAGDNTADAYLEIICREESQCILGSFTGHLGDIGLGLLQRPEINDCCREIKLKVKSLKSLEILCESLQAFQSLYHLHLVAAMTRFPFTSAKLPNVQKYLYLPYLTEETATNTAKFVARLSQSYVELVVHDTPLKVIEPILRCLKKRNVTVERFSGLIEQRESEVNVAHIGPLPLQYPQEEFRQRWSWYRSLVRKVLPTSDE